MGHKQNLWSHDQRFFHTVQFQYYLDVFLANVRNTPFVEWIAALCGAIQVLLAKFNRSSNYFFGIISTAVYIYIFAAGGLYADASLNVYYLAMSLYGLWHWQGEGRHIQVPVAFSQKKDWAIATGIAATALILGYTVLTQFTDSKVPLWDASVAAFAWAGMWLLARRKVENWLWLNVSNAIAIPLYFFKGMMLTMVLTTFLFTVALFGYFSWRKLANQSRH